MAPTRGLRLTRTSTARGRCSSDAEASNGTVASASVGGHLRDVASSGGTLTVGWVLSQREAARQSNHAGTAIRQAIRDGRLATDLAGKIDETELERFIGSLGQCRVPGCDQPARYPSYCCCRGHAVTAAKATTEWRECEHPDCRTMFRPRPDQLRQGQGECCTRKCAQELRRRREEAAGELVGERVICACGCGQSRLVFPSQRTAPPGSKPGYVAPYVYLNAAHWARHRWTHGIAVKSSLGGLHRGGYMSLVSLRRLHGRWAFAKGGGRPSMAVKDPEFEAKASEVLRLRRAHPKWGARTIAQQVGLSHWKVRDVLGAQGTP
jgi:hypothetical protein